MNKFIYLLFIHELFNFHHIFETKIHLKNWTERDSTQKRDIQL